METQTQQIEATEKPESLKGEAKKTNKNKESTQWNFTREGFPWETSIETDQIIPAFFTGLSKLERVKKDAKNPFFNNSPYATLPACLDAIDEAFDGLDVVIFHPCTTSEDGAHVLGATTLLHKSGQWMKHDFKFTVGKPENPQDVGKVQSYACRYDTRALGVVAEIDDDANSASGNRQPPQQTQQRANVASSKPQSQSAAAPKPVSQAKPVEPPTIQTSTNPTPHTLEISGSEDEQIASLINQVAVKYGYTVQVVSNALKSTNAEPKKDQINMLTLMLEDKKYGSIGRYLTIKKIGLGQALEQIKAAGGIDPWLNQA